MSRRRFLLGLAAATGWMYAQAQTWPARPIKLIVNFPPGGPGDAVARYIAQQASGLLGQQVVVDNRSGGAGAVGILAAANAAADGYTFLYTTTTGLVQVPRITKDASFDPLDRLVPVAGVGSTPIALLANQSVPASDFPSFVDWARKQAKGVDIGGGGPIVEIATAVLAQETGLKLIYVPYRGTAPVLQAALGGEIKVFFSTPSTTISDFVKAGKLKVLGTTSSDRSNLIPGVEPIAKYVPGYVQDINFAIFSPKGTSAVASSAFSQAVAKVLSEPGIAEKFSIFGLSARYLPAADVVRIAARDAAAIEKTLESTPIKFGE